MKLSLNQTTFPCIELHSGHTRSSNAVYRSFQVTTQLSSRACVVACVLALVISVLAIANDLDFFISVNFSLILLATSHAPTHSSFASSIILDSLSLVVLLTDLLMSDMLSLIHLLTLLVPISNVACIHITLYASFHSVWNMLLYSHCSHMIHLDVLKISNFGNLKAFVF